jgi:hypothetical protein
MSAEAVQQLSLFGDAGSEIHPQRRRLIRIEPWVQRLAEGIATGLIRVDHSGPLAPNRKIHGLNSSLIREAFCDYFGVRAEHADILVVLYERAGRSVPTRELAKLLNSHRPPARGAIHERIRFLREIMEPESLDSGGRNGERDGQGRLNEREYSLTETGLSECSEALRIMAEALLKCGPAAVIDGQSVEMIRQGAEP